MQVSESLQDIDIKEKETVAKGPAARVKPLPGDATPNGTKIVCSPCYVNLGMITYIFRNHIPARNQIWRFMIR